MNKDQVLGIVILLGCIFGDALYLYLLFLSPWAVLVLNITMFVAVTAVLLILAWIGYTLATTPPPAPIESFTESLEEETKTKEEKK
jgi:predicted DNA-binding transcriptional regulator